MVTKNKPQYKTEKVVLDDGSVVNICRIRMENVDLYMEIQERLLEKYVEEDGSMCKLLSDSDVYADLTSLCSIIPLVDKSKSGEDQYLDFESIKDNWEQIVILFFNGSLNLESRDIEGLTPSKLSKLHFFPYMETARKYLNKRLESEQRAETKD